MANNYMPPSLVAAEKENIHFSTLMNASHELIDSISGALWTDTAIHDPGITLLEALAWNISDLSYRCLLPLQDLLTPVEAHPGDSLFPAGFMPEQMLTTSPITVDDYRRGILDLYNHTGTGNPGYYFSDASVRKQSENEQFRAFYDAKNRQFVFETSSAVDENDYTPILLAGSYAVQARVSWLPYVDSTPAHAEVLNQYLETNRNLCETFRQVSIITSPAANGLLGLTLDIEISEEMENVNDLYAEVYIALHQSLALPLKRVAQLDLTRGEYSGPRAENGWIPQLPASDFGSAIGQVVSVGQFILSATALQGVESVRYISLDKDRLTLSKPEPEGGQFILWSDSNDLAQRITGLLAHVGLYRREVRLSGDPQAIVARVQAALTAVVSTPTPPIKVGRYRNLKRYYPASSLVPPLYNLQSWSPDETAQQLHHFLLGFEQQLASECAGLEQLCRMLSLSLDNSVEKPVYGSQWPFAAGTPYHAVYSEALRQKLQQQDALNQSSSNGELALVRYLLGYFGVESIEALAETDPRAGEFLKISHGLLQQMPQVGYARTAVHINQVSSLQRRLAEQLGYGSALFADNPPMDNLPFYLVEHALLLPEMPGKKDIPDGGKVKSARMVTIGDQELLLLEANGPLQGILTTRHMVNLNLAAGSASGEVHAAGTEISNLLVVMMGSDLETIPAAKDSSPATEVKNNCFFLAPQLFRMLRLHLDEVLNAVNNGLTFAFSNVWLNEMSYMLEEKLAEETSAGSGIWTIRTAPDQPWPAVLRIGDTLTLQPVFGSPAQAEMKEALPRSGQLTASVQEVDSIAGHATIMVDGTLDFSTWRYNWFIAPEGSNPLLERDRFSFTLSLVFPRSSIPEFDTLSVDSRAKEEQRIRRIVQGEVPAHIQTRLLWLSDEQFTAFAKTYIRWQQNKLGVGEATLTLLRMLSLGMLSDLLEGIGQMKIPSVGDEPALEALINAGKQGSPEWYQLINANSLLFIPPEG